MPVSHPSPLPTSFVGRMPPPSSAKLLGITSFTTTTATTTFSSSSSTTSSSSRTSPSISSIPIPASRERRAPHHAAVIAKRKRLASSASSTMAFAVGSPKEKRRSIFPTPPFDDNSGYMNHLDEDSKLDDDSLPFPMESPVTPPYPVCHEAITIMATTTTRSDADTKVTSDLLKGLGIRVVGQGNQVSIKHTAAVAAAAAAASYEGDDLDRTFLFDEEVGVGEAKFQSFVEAETNEESELESDLEDDCFD